MAKAKKIAIELTKKQASDLARLLLNHVDFTSLKSARDVFYLIADHPDAFQEELDVDTAIPRFRSQFLTKGGAKFVVPE